MNVWLGEFWRTWRASLRRPGFLLLATGVLALGIGASVAVFALIDNIVLRPLPVPQASRLVVLGRMRGEQVHTISQQQYQHLASLDGVVSMGLELAGSVGNIAGSGTPEQVSVIHVDRQVLPTLGLQPILGRNFNEQEDRPNGPKAVILGYGFWQRRYGGDAGVIGRSMQVEGITHSIVGVLPASFGVAMGTDDIMLPMALPVDSQEDSPNYTAIARLADGAGIAAVSAEVDARLHAMYQAMSNNDQTVRFGAGSFATWKHEDAQPMLILFPASALLVLLIALVNLTNLMLLRTLSRNHDAAVRSALGAPLLRLMLPALGEGLLVGLSGALLGMLLAGLGLALLQGFIPAVWLPDGRVHMGIATWGLAFAIGLLGALLAAVLGLWRSRTATTVNELREGGRSGTGVRSGRLGRMLVVAQVALAVILLCATGVFMHALYDASQLRLGFTSENILTFELMPVKADYPNTAAVQSLSQRLVQRLRAVPGITDAAVMTNLPSSDHNFGQFNTDVHEPGGISVDAQYHIVDPGFFKLFSIALHEGRNFTRDDVHGGEPVAIVSQKLASEVYAGRALGKLIQVEGSGNIVWSLRIVGVVGDTYQEGPLHPEQPMVYVPLAQMPDEFLAFFRNLEPLRFALRGHGSPDDWRVGVREALADIAPDQPIANLRTMHSIVNQTTADARLDLLLIGTFAALALLLAVAGLYAVMAVAVTAREREFGVRMALGAQPSRLVRLVLRGGFFQIAAGLVIGVGIALGISRLLSMLLMLLLGRSSAADPIAVLGVCVVLALAGLLACLLPALRASRVQPMRALRGE